MALTTVGQTHTIEECKQTMKVTRQLRTTTNDICMYIGWVGRTVWEQYADGIDRKQQKRTKQASTSGNNNNNGTVNATVKNNNQQQQHPRRSFRFLVFSVDKKIYI